MSAAPSVSSTDIEERLASGSLLGAIETCLDSPGRSLPLCDPCPLPERDDDLADLVAIAGGEPVLAAALLREANGPGYDALTRADSLEQALQRIGSREARRVIEDLNADGPYSGSDQVLVRALRDARTRALAVARTGARIAEAAGNPELASKIALLGLLSDMGVPFLARALSLHDQGRRETPLLNDFATGEILAELGERCGLRLLERWRLAPRTLAVLQGQPIEVEDRRLATLLGMARTIVSSIAPGSAASAAAGGSDSASEWGQALWNFAESLGLSDVDVAALQVHAEDDLEAVAGTASPRERSR